MASFTDLIPQFNPYVQQLPVEDMIKVGMEKQDRYNEGIQKIQSQIDKVGGMDIYKPVHRMYLQSKLNELGNNLKLVAAGDFSNFQLVNSVGGMIGQVVKDPVVKNAYESTQLLRKQQGYMEEAKNAGKSSPDNEWWFMNEIDRWQNDPDLMKKFTGEYIQYRDVDKKLRDVASKIKEIEKSEDIPYVRDAQGNVVMGRDGNLIVDNAMLRIKVKGTPAEKILNNFYSSLDEGDKRQLMITGNYHYKNASKATFRNDIIGTYDGQKKALADNLSKLAVELKTNDKLTSAQKAEIEAAINKGVEKINSRFFEKEAATKIDEIDKVTNMEDFKYRVYTQKYLTGLAQDLSNESYTEEILSNPYAQMNMKKKTLDFQVQRARQEHDEFLMTHSVALDRLAIEQKKPKAEEEEREKLKPKTQYGGLKSDAPPPMVGDLEKSMDDIKKQMTSLKVAAGPELFPTIKGKDDKPLTGDVLLKAQQDALDALVDKYIANPTSIRDNDEREFVEQMRVLQLKQIQQGNLYTEVTKIDKTTNVTLEKEFEGWGGVNFPDGKPIYSAADLYKAQSILQKFRSVSSGGVSPTTGIPGKITVSTDDVGYLNSLPSNLKGLGRTLLKWNSGQQLTATEKVIADRSQKIFMNFRGGAEKIVADGVKAQSNYLSTYMPEVQVTSGTLNMDNKATAKNVEFLIGNATRFYDQMGYLDQENSDDFSPSKVSKMRVGEGAKEVRYVVERNYDGSGRLLMYDKDNNKQIIPLSQSDLATYFPDVAKSSFMTNVKYDIMSSPGRTTNTIARENPVGARYSGYDIGGLRYSQYAPRVRVDIEGAKGNNGGEGDRFQVRLYAFDGTTWKHAVLNQQGHIGAAGVEDILSQIGPLTVEEVLSQK